MIEHHPETVHAAGGGYGPPPGGAPPGGYAPPPGGAPPAGGAPMAPPGGAPMAPPGGAAPPGAAPGGGGGDLKKQAQMWLIISIVSVFLCGNGCFGWIGAILAFLGMQAADQGDVAGAESKTKWAKIVTIIGMVIGILLTILYVILVVVLEAM